MQEKKKKKMSRDTWHVTCETLHMTCDIQEVVKTVCTFQVPSSYGFGVKMIWTLGGKGSVTHLNNQLMTTMFNRPGVAGAVPQSPSWLPDSWSQSVCQPFPPELLIGPQITWPVQGHSLHYAKKRPLFFHLDCLPRLPSKWKVLFLVLVLKFAH